MLSVTVVRCLALAGRRTGSAARRQSTLTPPARIGVLGAQFERGQGNPGVSEGASAIRKTGLITRLTEMGHDVLDYGNHREQSPSAYMTGPDGEKDFLRVLQYCESLAESVARVHSDGRLCVALGGDHSVAIGTIAGHCSVLPDDHQLSVLWVDAHADLNTGSSSGSGNMHGMALGFLLKELQHNTIETGFPKSCISCANLAYIGLRDLDPEETKTLQRLDIKAFTTRDMDRLGVHAVVSQCLEHLRPGPDRPLHVSFDIDALDPGVAPATGTPVHGGLSTREGCVIVEAAHATGHLAAIDVVEINPALADSKGTANTALAARTLLLAALAGHRGT